MSYGIINKNRITVAENVNTTASIYPITAVGRAWRKFGTRAAARAFKRTLGSRATNFTIVNSELTKVVR